MDAHTNSTGRREPWNKGRHALEAQGNLGNQDQAGVVRTFEGSCAFQLGDR